MQFAKVEQFANLIAEVGVVGQVDVRDHHEYRRVSSEYEIGECGRQKTERNLLVHH
jgi:hypothetical protein